MIYYSRSGRRIYDKETADMIRTVKGNILAGLAMGMFVLLGYLMLLVRLSQVK